MSLCFASYCASSEAIPTKPGSFTGASRITSANRVHLRQKCCAAWVILLQQLYCSASVVLRIDDDVLPLLRRVPSR